MPSKESAPDTAAGIPADPRWQLAGRIAASRTFSKSPRLRDFLLYVTQRTLEGDIAAVTEIEIAHHIFGRGLDFVPTEDSVVRVSARQLRAKLKEYFDTEGCLEPLLLEIPKGAYLPVFHPRLPLTPESPPLVPAPQPSRWRLAFWAALSLNLLLLLVVALLARRPPSPPSLPASPPNLLSLLLAPATSPVQVVVSDFSLSLMRSVRPNGKDYGLAQYLSWNYDDLRPAPASDPRLVFLWSVLRTHRVTRLGDLTVVASIERAANGSHAIAIRHSRDVSLRDFHTGWHVLLGNPYSTPWVSLFEDQLGFRSTRNDINGVGFLNAHPRSNEPAAYFVPHAEREDGIGYARIAFLPNTSGRPGVLLIGGVNMVSMEAAGDFLAHPDSINRLRSALALPPNAVLPYFELLLQTRSLDNTPQGATIVAAHLLDHPR
jgi:hypothetical protein